MGIRHRCMRLSDIPECVKCVAAHATLGPRYGSGIADLSVLLRRLLANEWFFSHALFEEVTDGKVKLHGVGFSVFVCDKFLAEAKKPPMFWLGPEIARRVVCGDSPLLTEKQVAEANSGAGLNVVVCQTGFDPDNMDRPEATMVAANTFIEDHRGFRLNETLVQAESANHLAGVLNFGALLYSHTDRSYRDLAKPDHQQIAMQPHLVGTTWETARRCLGSWLASLYLYERPRFGFSRSEQRLLLAALDGKTDDELSDSLDISLAAVKKTWRAIYLRVANVLPGMIPSPSEDSSGRDRGKEKKRHLLAYLRDHPEELRPYRLGLLQRELGKSRRSAALGSKSGLAHRGFP